MKKEFQETLNLVGQPFRAKSVKPLLLENKRTIVAISLFLGAATVIYTFFVYKPTYNANATVIIKNTPFTGKFVTEDSNEVTTSPLSNPVLNTMSLLKTSAIRNGLWEYLQKNRPDELERLKIHTFDEWKQFFGNGSSFISSKNLLGTDYIELKFKWGAPDIAKDGLLVVLDSFKEASLKLNQNEQHERSKYLSLKITEVNNQLQAVREQIDTLKEQNQTVDLDSDKAEYSKGRIGLAQTLKEIESEARAKQTEAKQYENMLGMDIRKAVHASAVGGNSTISELYGKLYSQREEYKALQAHYKDSHVKMQELNQQMSQTEQDIVDESRRMGTGASQNPKEPSNPTAAVVDRPRSEAIIKMMDAKTESQQLLTKASVLQGYMTSINQKMATLPRVEKQLAGLKDQEDSLSESLKTLKQKELDANLRELQTLSNVFIIDYPELPLRPAFPNRIHILLGGLLLSFASAFSHPFLKRKLQTTLQVQINNPIVPFHPLEEITNGHAHEVSHAIYE
jgi:uncharacterized protein involved in exopolysaccharide biosynthesis